jgi:hypothetical protein
MVWAQESDSTPGTQCHRRISGPAGRNLGHAVTSRGRGMEGFQWETLLFLVVPGSFGCTPRGSALRKVSNGSIRQNRQSGPWNFEAGELPDPCRRLSHQTLRILYFVLRKAHMYEVLLLGGLVDPSAFGPLLRTSRDSPPFGIGRHLTYKASADFILSSRSGSPCPGP